MRIQLEISGNKHKQIKTLMEKADFKTYSELFNNAVTLLQWSIRQIEEGHSILWVDQGSGREKELLMPFFRDLKQSVSEEVELAPAQGSRQKR
jgi:Arc/MetJ-type ribon-helix-helix transcriptional regulator